MNEQLDVTLVVKPIHDATRRAYDYKMVEAPTEIVEEQLSKDDKQRNFHWQGVRLATESEKTDFYKQDEVIEKKKPGPKPKTQEA